LTELWGGDGVKKIWGGKGIEEGVAKEGIGRSKKKNLERLWKGLEKPCIQN